MYCIQIYPEKSNYFIAVLQYLYLHIILKETNVGIGFSCHVFTKRTVYFMTVTECVYNLKLITVITILFC